MVFCVCVFRIPQCLSSRKVAASRFKIGKSILFPVHFLFFLDRDKWLRPTFFYDRSLCVYVRNRNVCKTMHEAGQKGGIEYLSLWRLDWVKIEVENIKEWEGEME